MEPHLRYQRIAEISAVFTPGSPVNTLDLFAGRKDQILALLAVLGQRGQHAVLYGERGVGKTSFANILTDLFHDKSATPIAAVRVNCASDDTFASLWASIFRRLRVSVDEDRPLTPEHVVDLLEQQSRRPLIVIDELDRYENDDGLSLMADTIKALSDHAVPATLMLVGVADSINQLIGDHRSVERALVQIQMPRMSVAELELIVDKGLSKLRMTISRHSKTRIARLSEGLPFYTHLLSRSAAIHAAEDDRAAISERDLDRATQDAVDKAQQSILSDYEKAIRSAHTDNLYKEVLLACALTDKTAEGFFSPGNVRLPMARITGKNVTISAYSRHLNEFAGAHRAAVLVKDGSPRRYFYRFTNPILQPYVVLRGIADGLMTEDLLTELRHPGKDSIELPEQA
ncbi:MAG: orc1/cdc6 family replication initiation protein [Planctomycetes bacterium]|nr:orc1/cdc6 family replication initiation protein [Planctomycetota bacterium]